MIDLTNLSNQIDEVISYSQGTPKNPEACAAIINKWYHAKKYFIDNIGENLIYTSPTKVNFKLNLDMKAEKLIVFARMASSYNIDLGKFIEELSVEEFFNNLTSKEYCIYDIVIPSKYRVIKAFKFFNISTDELKLLQSAASRIIQEDSVSGYLCISVHPLDYLSASETTYNWRSCHALNGEYRSGNLSYMLDESTVICYLCSEKEEKLPRFPNSVLWNSKKWRIWLHFSNDKTMLMAGRQYPFTCTTSLDTVKEMLLSKFPGRWSSFYKDTFHLFKEKTTDTNFTFYRGIPVGGNILSITNLVHNGFRNLAYNDILKNSHYEPAYAYRHLFFDKKTGNTNNDTRFIIGAESPCPVCGKNFVPFHNIMACVECVNKYQLLNEYNNYYSFCSICGLALNEDIEELSFLSDSQTQVCSSCYEQYTNECQKCGVRDLTNFVFKRKNGMCLCNLCMEE